MKFYRDKARKIRKEKKLSMEEVCKIGDFGRSSLSNWELGIKTPTESKIRLLARILDVPV